MSRDYASLTYLVLLLCAVVFCFMVANRDTLNKLAQQALIWALIFVAAIAVVGLWDDIRNVVTPHQTTHANGQIELPRARDGHYYVTAQVNNAEIRFVVDTGATGIVLTQKDAALAGIDIANLAFVGQANTANGMVSTAPIRIDEFAIGPIRDTRLRAWVNKGEMEMSLLGMSYLQRYSKIEITGGALILSR